MKNDDMYERIDPPSPMTDCACCGATAELWKYRGDPDGLLYVPGCSIVEGFGELSRLECPMYELNHLKCRTKKQAVQYWNDFNSELRNSRARHEAKN